MKIVLAAVAVPLLLLGAAAPARAAEDAAPELHSIEFSRETVTVNGLQVKLLTVSAHLTDDGGIREHGDSVSGWSPTVQVGPPGKFVRLVLGSGTPKDGVYTGGIAVTSEWSGAYRPTKVFAEDETGDQLYIDPGTVLDDLPTVTVTSSGRPKVHFVVTPSPAAPGAALTQRITVTDSATGRPVAHAPVAIGQADSCPEEGIRGPVGTTDESGVFTRTLPAGQTYDYFLCAWVTADNVPEQPATRIATTTAFANYRYRITASPAASSAPAGSNVAVTGTVAPNAQGKELQLQRLYAPGDWRTVNRGTVDPNSRFRIVATPPGTSTYSYRIFAPGQESRTAGYSPIFTIRGT